MNLNANGTKAHKDLIKHKREEVQFQVIGIWSENQEKNGEKQEVKKKVSGKVILKTVSKINLKYVTKGDTSDI